MFLGVQNSSATFEDAVPQHLTLKSHPSRPLILAFNFPAVALVLGSEKWPYLLPTYLTLTKDSTFEVRRTLAASIGEMAKIIGSNNAETDLVNVWCRLAESEEDDVRIKIVESLLVFLQSLEDRGRGVVLRQLVHHWKQNLWRGWRERAAIAKCIVSFMSIVAQVPDSLHMVGELFSLVLRDPVSAVREIGVQAVCLLKLCLLPLTPPPIAAGHLVELQGRSFGSPGCRHRFLRKIKLVSSTNDVGRPFQATCIAYNRFLDSSPASKHYYFPRDLSQPS